MSSEYSKKASSSKGERFLTGLTLGLWGGNVGADSARSKADRLSQAREENQARKQEVRGYTSIQGDGNEGFAFDGDGGFGGAAAIENEPAAFQSGPSRGPGSVVAIFGCRGGAGSTTLAINMAAEFASSNVSTCIVDLDLQMGDLFVGCGIEKATQLAVLARQAALVDDTVLKKELAYHDAGFCALSQTGEVGVPDPSFPEHVGHLLTVLTHHFDIVLLDGIRDFSPTSRAALHVSDHVLLVAPPDVPAVRRAARVVNQYRQLEHDPARLFLVLNRCTSKDRLPQKEIERALGLRVFARVRNHYRAARDALDQGLVLRDVAGGSTLRKDIRSLTKQTLEIIRRSKLDVAFGRRGKKGLIARWFGDKGTSHGST